MLKSSYPFSILFKFFKTDEAYACTKFHLIFTLLFFAAPVLLSQEKEVLEELLTTIEEAQRYDALKLEKIEDLREELEQTRDSDVIKRYNLNRDLYYEYRIFKQDSAFKYGLRSRNLAVQLDSVPLIAEASVNLADISISAGMFKEALEFLETVEPDEIPENLTSYYYGLLGRCYSDMAEFSNLSFFTKKYNELANTYHQLTLPLIEPGTINHSILLGYINYRKGNLDEALGKMIPLLERDLSLREKAVVNSVLGDIYAKNNEKEKAVFHLAQASIADIRTSTKENLAMIRLAELLFEKGDIRHASLFIQKANDDAIFYGAQQRKIRVGAILPLIEEKMVQMIEGERQRLYRQNVIVSLLLLFVIILAVIIYSQVRKLKAAKRTIEEAHLKLQSFNEEIITINGKLNDTNEELKKVNDQLLEANTIKEEYIGFFFTQDADIFEKFREFKSGIEESLKEDNLAKVKYLVSSYDLKREKKKLLENFDTAFLKLFPNFTEEFNLLLKPDQQITLKEGQLNKELRIFALMRLGITHNEIIAQILGYSVNSIYAYKTKIRNKSRLENKEFDQILFENTTLKV